MSLLRFPQGHGPVTVSLLLPLITLASSLAFRPAPATAPAAPAADEPQAVELAATPADGRSCEPAAAHACAANGDRATSLVIVKAEAAAPADVPAVAIASAPGTPSFGFELARAVSADAGVQFHAAAFSYTGDDDMPIVLMDPSRGESVSFWHSDGSTALRRLEKTEKGRFLWFRSEGRDFVIRDAALLDRAEEIVEPQSKLGRAQGELGGVQGRMGGEQGQLGARQGEYGRRLGELARREARLQARLHRASLSASEERELEAELEEVRDARERAQAAMESLGRGQARMGARQAELGRRQAELGRRQAALSKEISRELKALVREALRTGKAVRLGAEVY